MPDESAEQVRKSIHQFEVVSHLSRFIRPVWDWFQTKFAEPLHALRILSMNAGQRALGVIPVVTVSLALAEAAFGIAMLFFLTPFSYPFVAIAFLGFAVAFAALTVSGVRLARWSRQVIGEFWERYTPPHTHDETNRWPTADQLTFWDQASRLPTPESDETLTHATRLSLATLGLYFVALLITFLLVDQPGIVSQMDYVVESNVSTPVAFISMFAGQVVGLFLLATATVIESPQNFIVIILIFGLPLVGAAPTARNLIEYSEAVHRRWVEAYAEEYDNPKLVYIGVSGGLTVGYLLTALMMLYIFAPSLF